MLKSRPPVKICRWFLFFFAGCSPLHTAPPPPVPFLIQHDYDPTLDLFGGGNYMTPDDNLILDSMTAAEGMSKLKRIENAKENLQKLLNPVALHQLRAPAEMGRQLYRVLYWLSQAYDAEASPQQMLEEVCPKVTGSAEGATTLREVLLYNFHMAQHLGVIDFQGQMRLGLGRPPAVRENDDNADNRLALAIPILPPDHFPEVAHQLFNYELFDGPLPKAPSPDLAPSQVEFAQKLIARRLLSPNALQPLHP